jgi:hypothetical protein
METLITVCHRRKEPRMTQPTEELPQVERLNATRRARRKAKKERVLSELREAEAFLREIPAGTGAPVLTAGKSLALARTISTAIRLITQLKSE